LIGIGSVNPALQGEAARLFRLELAASTNFIGMLRISK
jgi:hypothetical protein